MDSKRKYEELISENKEKANKSHFNVGDPVFYRYKDNSGEEATKCGSIFEINVRYTFPIRVRFNDDFSQSSVGFTLDGRFRHEEQISLFFDQRGYEESQEGDEKVESSHDTGGKDVTINKFDKPYFWKDQKVVCEVYEDTKIAYKKGIIVSIQNSQLYPILVSFEDGGRQTFTSYGSLLQNSVQALFPYKQKEHDKKEFLSINETDTNDYDHVKADHYRKSPIEAIEIMDRVYGKDLAAIWCEMTAFKYRLRLGHKPTSPIEDDLEKESRYLEMANERLEESSRQALIKKLKDGQ